MRRRPLVPLLAAFLPWLPPTAGASGGDSRPPESALSVETVVAPGLDDRDAGPLPELPKGPGTESALKKADEDASSDPERRGKTRELVRKQYASVLRAIDSYDRWSMAMAGVGSRQACRMGPDVAHKWLQWAKEAQSLRQTLRSKYPYGYQAVEGSKENKLELETLDQIERQAKANIPELELADKQCSYGQQRLAAQGDKAVSGVEKSFAGGLDTPGLNKRFDNLAVAGDPGSLVAGRAGTPGTPKAPDVPAPSGLKTKEPPRVETFESLTEGIEFRGPEKVRNAVGVMVDNPKKKVFDEALRHIYEIPEGRQVLRDIQATRGEMAEQFRSNAEQQKKELPALKEKAAAAEAKLAQFYKDNPPGQPAPKPSGRLFLTKTRTPETKDAPGSDDVVDGEQVAKCPPGTKPVLTGHPKPGDMGCRDAKDPPKIRVHTDNAFQPYEVRDKCPQGHPPVVTNWPELGDMECKGMDLASDVKKLKEQVQGADYIIGAQAQSPKPVVGVEIDKPLPLTGGHADPLQYQIWKDPKRGLYYVTLVNVSDEYLKDGNPSRPVDKVMIHELRHVADQKMFKDAADSGVRWVLGEDRAYLSEARAVMEQQPAMRKEKRSPAVESMKQGEVADLLRNPAGERIDRVSSPLYLWHVGQADLEAPGAALRRRLSRAYSMLRWSDGDYRRQLAGEIDSGGQLQKALEQARSETWPKRGRLPDSDAEQARFLELAEQTPMAQSWLARVKRFSGTILGDGAPAPEWKGRYQALESQYWEDVGNFVARYRGMLPGIDAEGLPPEGGGGSGPEPEPAPIIPRPPPVRIR